MIYNKEMPQKRRSPKRRSPKRRSPKRSPKKSTPGTPTVRANTLSEGAKRKGRDGHFYRVEQKTDGKLFWRKCGKNDGGANCRFIGPARK